MTDYAIYKALSAEERDRLGFAKWKEEQQTLALPDAEPIGYMRPDELRKAASQPYLCRVHPAKDKHADMVPVYATPQPAIAPEPVWLTDDERDEVIAPWLITGNGNMHRLVSALEDAIHTKQDGKP